MFWSIIFDYSYRLNFNKHQNVTIMDVQKFIPEKHKPQLSFDVRLGQLVLKPGPELHYDLCILKTLVLIFQVHRTCNFAIHFNLLHPQPYLFLCGLLLHQEMTPNIAM